LRTEEEGIAGRQGVESEGIGPGEIRLGGHNYGVNFLLASPPPPIIN